MINSCQNEEGSIVVTPKSEQNNMCSFQQFQQLFESFTLLSPQGIMFYSEKKGLAQLKLNQQQTQANEPLNISSDDEEISNKDYQTDIKQFKSISFEEIQDTFEDVNDSIIYNMQTNIEDYGSIKKKSSEQMIQFFEDKQQQVNILLKNSDFSMDSKDQKQDQELKEKDAIIQKQQIEIKDLNLKLYWLQKIKKEQILKLYKQINAQQQWIQDQKNQVIYLQQIQLLKELSQKNTTNIQNKIQQKNIFIKHMVFNRHPHTSFTPKQSFQSQVNQNQVFFFNQLQIQNKNYQNKDNQSVSQVDSLIEETETKKIKFKKIAKQQNLAASLTCRLNIKNH